MSSWIEAKPRDLYDNSKESWMTVWNILFLHIDFINYICVADYQLASNNCLILRVLYWQRLGNQLNDNPESKIIISIQWQSLQYCLSSLLHYDIVHTSVVHEKNLKIPEIRMILGKCRVYLMLLYKAIVFINFLVHIKLKIH